jgi:threonine/homoserine/homoserine lactone efflux protein
MAVVTSRDRTAFAVDADRAGAATSGGAQVLNAFVLNILNPKLTIFFLAYLPQFVDAAADRPLAQLLTLSALFMAMTFAVFVVYGLVAHALRRHVMGSARVQQGLRRGFSAAFAALGARLALSEH